MGKGAAHRLKSRPRACASVRVLVVPAVLAFLLAGCATDTATTPAATREDALDPGSLLASALYDVGVRAFEPTMGIDPEGRLYFAGVSDGVAIGAAPLVMRSDDRGATWTDVSPRLGPVTVPPETNDPFVYVDPGTGRVFQFAMAPILVCAVLSWSDDAGESWTTNPRGCGNTPPWDHQSMVAAAPRTVTTPLYPNVLHQCVNNMAATTCSRSLDGGLTWSPGTPVLVDPECGGLHGHLVASPDGTVFLPKMHCGVPTFARTQDDGLTWTFHTVSDVPGHPWPDPAMAVDAEGNVYYAWVGETGDLLLSMSADLGETWSEPISVNAPGVTTHIPALAAGPDGRLALAYPGTSDLPEGYGSDEELQDAATWHAWVTIVTGLADGTPTLEHARATPADDPLVRGRCGPERCPGMTDFIDVVMGADGTAYASFVDVCSAECAADPEGANDQEQGVVMVVQPK